MLHILLLIVKIIGILILAILGLLLMMILIVLFVPVRYKALAVYEEEKFTLDASVSWMLHVIHARVLQKGEKPHITIRLFGFLLYDSNRERKEKSVKKSGKSHKTGKMRTLNIEKKSKEKKSKEQNSKEQNSKEQSGVNQEPGKDDAFKLETLVTDGKQSVAEQKIDPDGKVMIPKQPDFVSEHRELLEEEEKQGVFETIAVKLRKVKLKIAAFFQRIKDTMKKIAESFYNIKNKINIITDFLKDDQNKEALKITWSGLKRFLKHIIPRKLTADLIFGTGDPCSTGQALGAIGLLYGIYGEHLRITPDFENKRLEGRLYAKGRIRFLSILIIMLKLIMDKHVKELRANLKILKEAL